jgi:transcriptional regulator with XRE-family HTH domain
LRPPEQQQRGDGSACRRKRWDDYYYRAFGQRLQYARSQRGISEEDAAYALDVTVRKYRAYEAGKRSFVCHDGFVDFAHTFGISLEWLLGRKGAEPPRFRLRAV